MRGALYSLWTILVLFLLVLTAESALSGPLFAATAAGYRLLAHRTLGGEGTSGTILQSTRMPGDFISPAGHT